MFICLFIVWCSQPHTFYYYKMFQFITVWTILSALISWESLSYFSTFDTIVGSDSIHSFKKIHSIAINSSISESGGQTPAQPLDSTYKIILKNKLLLTTKNSWFSIKHNFQCLINLSIISLTILFNKYIEVFDAKGYGMQKIYSFGQKFIGFQ